MAKKASIVAFVVVLILGGLLVSGYWSLYRHQHNSCGYCQRPVNPKLAVIAVIDGVERRVCCASCAMTEARQQRKPLRLKSVTDYVTGRSLNPADAWFVVDGRAMACTHEMAMTDETKHLIQESFDRCAPGAFAFSSEQQARSFVQANGGMLRRLPELEKEVQQ